MRAKAKYFCAELAGRNFCRAAAGFSLIFASMQWLSRINRGGFRRKLMGGFDRPSSWSWM